MLAGAAGAEDDETAREVDEETTLDVVKLSNDELELDMLEVELIALVDMSELELDARLEAELDVETRPKLELVDEAIVEDDEKTERVLKLGLVGVAEEDALAEAEEDLDEIRDDDDDEGAARELDDDDRTGLHFPKGAWQPVPQ